MKVKIISNDLEEHLEDEVNYFIKGKKILDIQYTQAFIGNNNTNMSAMIVYEEDK